MIKVCKNPACAKEYSTDDKRQKFCGKACNYACRPTNKIKKICEHCGADVFIYPSRNDGRYHFCNMDCRKAWEKRPKEKKKKLEYICEQCSISFVPRNKQARFCSNECRLEALNYNKNGENNPAWRGGITSFRRTVETTAAYQKWRKDVFKRDKYHCRVCGSNKKIQVHHIKTFAEHPELRMDMKNGVTLCAECHLQTYGKEDRFEQYFDFLVCKAEVHGFTT